MNYQQKLLIKKYAKNIKNCIETKKNSSKRFLVLRNRSNNKKIPSNLRQRSFLLLFFLIWIFKYFLLLLFTKFSIYFFFAFNLIYPFVFMLVFRLCLKNLKNIKTKETAEKYIKNKQNDLLTCFWFSSFCVVFVVFCLQFFSVVPKHLAKTKDQRREEKSCITRKGLAETTSIWT